MNDAQRATHMNRLSTLPSLLAAGKEPDKLAQAAYLESGMALLFDFLNNVALLAESNNKAMEIMRKQHDMRYGQSVGSRGFEDVPSP